MPTLSTNLIRRLEKSAQDSGINVALYYIERSKFYKKFQSDLEQSLLEQITKVATNSNVDRLMMFGKAKTVNPSMVKEIATIIISIGELVSFSDLFQNVGNAAGQYKIEQYGIDAKFIMKNQALVNYFDDHSKLLINTVDDTTKEWLAAKIQDGIDNSTSLNDLVNMLVEEGKAISRARAETILITETASAVSVVQQETARQYGIKEQVWRTSLDDTVCDICLPLEGTKFATDTGVGNLPPAHPRCRCFTEDVIPNDWQSGDWTGE